MNEEHITQHTNPCLEFDKALCCDILTCQSLGCTLAKAGDAPIYCEGKQVLTWRERIEGILRRLRGGPA